MIKTTFAPIPDAQIVQRRHNRVTSGRTFVAAILGLALTTAAVAQGGARKQQLARDLTTQLVTLGSQIDLSTPASGTQALNRLTRIAAARRVLLSSLVEEDPAAVLQVALPSDMRAKLPAKVQAFIEQEEQLEGLLQVAIEEKKDGSSKIHYGLTNAAEHVSLHFAGNPPGNLLTGSRVRVKGVRVNAGLAIQSSGNNSSTSTSGLQVLALASPNTFGAQSTAVILVNFLDTAPPADSTAIYNVVFGTTSNFDMENSVQQTWLTGNVYGWYTIPMSSTMTTCDYSSIGNYARQAATNAGVNLSSYAHQLYVFPIVNACGWWGHSTVGGTPSYSWINGPPFDIRVIGHELGHGFGLYHSHALNCGSASIGTSCSTIEYGDTLDLMGNSSYVMGGDFNAFQKESLSWLNYGGTPPLTTVQSSGTYTIGSFEAQDATPKALKILQSSTTNTYYYVEYRTAQGFDSFLSGNANVLNGVVVHQGTAGNLNSSYLLNMNPAAGSFTYPALDVGQTFTDSAAGVTITPSSVTGTAATINVTLNNSVTCTQANPGISISPSQSQYVAPGTTVSYTVAISNKDSSGCPSSTFKLSGSVPSGWAGVFGSSSVTLAPGDSISTSFQVTSPTTATSGLYSIAATDTNSSATTYTATASATCAVSAPPPVSGSLAVTVSTNQSTYTISQTVKITAVVTSGGSPLGGTTVNIAIRKPNGSVVTQAVTTGSNGVAALSYRLKRQDPKGTYVVNASISTGTSSSAVQSTTSFTVQ